MLWENMYVCFDPGEIGARYKRHRNVLKPVKAVKGWLYFRRVG